MSRVYTGRWDWQFYPPPYTGLFQGVATPQPAPRVPVVQGLGDCGCGCNGHGDCKPSGLGFFDSGIDYETWGVLEWGAIAAGLYFVGSIIGDTNRGIQRTRRYSRVVKSGFRAGYRAGREL
jgi:hypothetical protein